MTSLEIADLLIRRQESDNLAALLKIVARLVGDRPIDYRDMNLTLIGPTSIAIPSASEQKLVSQDYTREVLIFGVPIAATGNCSVKPGGTAAVAGDGWGVTSNELLVFNTHEHGILPKLEWHGRNSVGGVSGQVMVAELVLRN